MRNGLYLDAEARHLGGDKELIPRRFMIAMAGLAVAALCLASFAVLTDRPLTGAPKAAPIEAAKIVTIESDGRSILITDDVGRILLDVDNGPDGIVREGNERLYTKTGLGRARDALNPGGVLAVWSAAPDHKFTTRLKGAGFDVDVRTVRARPNNKGPQHTIWFATRKR